MKKPEKIELLPMVTDYRGGHKTVDWIKGRNQAIDEYEKFLPGEKELYEIIKLNSGEASPSSPWGWRKFIARKIFQRLRGEKK